MHELLTANGLGHFYDLGPRAGVRVARPVPADRFAFLDDPAVRDRLIEFADTTSSRVTFHVPSIHCIACVWLLEHLFRLHPAFGRSEVNFPRKEVTLSFAQERMRLSEAVAFLSSLGYEPAFNLASVDAPAADRSASRLWLRLGVAGFAFGNIMMLSFPAYLGLGASTGAGVGRFFGLLSIGLALPVLVYGAADYWRAAWVCVRQRVLTIELPIALGLVALFGQSLFDILTGRGEGYLDSMTGLVFFLLCGRWFQQKTYDRLSFDRDYKAFFPLAVTRLEGDAEEAVPLAKVAPGDRLRLRHGELLPADARLTGGEGLIDYSFVTGESEPVARAPGEFLWAGGQQVGGAIEVEVVKPVSQSYLTSLWGHATLAKRRSDSLQTITNRFSRRFTVTVVLVALAAGAYWAWADPTRAVSAFTAVLIVACPCALALAAPFALGTAQRLLARRGFFLKNPHVLEALARIDTVVFDKTGTLTTAGAGRLIAHGAAWTAEERAWVRALASQSTHPYARRLAELWRTELAAGDGAAGSSEGVDGFQETAGCGIEGRVAGHEVRLGSAAWLIEGGVRLPPGVEPTEASVQVAIDGQYRGAFRLENALRPQIEALLDRLGRRYALALSSGDRERGRAPVRRLFGAGAPVHFNQNPADKLEFVRRLQAEGHTVLMAGDGLNDAGALRQSDVGLAVVERIGAFSPASDAICAASQVVQLDALLRYARRAVRVVWISLGLSSAYNVVGLSIAASGSLSPLICAVLMPLSSITVVAFACAGAHWAIRRAAWPETEGGRSA